MSKQLTTIELFKEDMKFSAAHYTIFSATERETLHGHNFKVYAAITASINSLGMPFDYDIYKTKLRKLCKELNQLTLIAGTSEHQRLEKDGDYLYVHFADEKIPFLNKDVKILPICNITVEELAGWFINRLTADASEITKYGISDIVIKVYSGEGQCAGIQWDK
ncbi:MAG: 6-pyruvoyl tetrahydrobiopterin synthase [Legionellales bacterium]|nr:6-pyruvoyl tetrahydrobiopterin synthase [Legionellales bacterium]|tara:strand:- start:1536 stop:2027 length:492 start_codon:yes stop_codon:yes gene_type:complete